MYQVKINVDVLFEGTVYQCFEYLVDRFGDETLSEIYDTGYRIESIAQ